MTTANTMDLLTQFGLTRQEAAVYLGLLANGDMNGYEAAKRLGISRSNAYTALAGLVDKGAAWLIDGNVTRYTALPGAEFCDNRLRALARSRDELLSVLPEQKIETGFQVPFHDSVADHDEHHYEQRRHQHFHGAFDTTAQTAADDDERDDHEHRVPQQHQRPGADMAAEHLADLLGRSGERVAIPGLTRPNANRRIAEQLSNAIAHDEGAEAHPAQRVAHHLEGLLVAADVSVAGEEDQVVRRRELRGRSEPSVSPVVARGELLGGLLHRAAGDPACGCRGRGRLRERVGDVPRR